MKFLFNMFLKKNQLDANLINQNLQKDCFHVDLGCFTRPRGASVGIDAKIPPSFPNNSKFLQCNLGFDKIPLEDNSVDLVTAFDFLEHVPRLLWFYDVSDNNKVDVFNSICAEKNGLITIIKPSIFLMNEIFRILKPSGQFLSCTPAIGQINNQLNSECLISIHKDPTHVNVWTYEGFKDYFCPPDFKPELYQQQLSNGIRTFFKPLAWGESCKFLVDGESYCVSHNGTHLTMVLEKPFYNKYSHFLNE